MAVMGAPQSAGASGIKIALVVFVVLTVASLAGTVVLYTYQADLQDATTRAQEQASNAENRLRENQNQVQEFAKDVIGEPTDELAKVKQAIANIRQKLTADPNLKNARIAPDASLIPAMNGVYAQFSAQAELLASVTAERDQLRAAREELEKSVATTRDEYLAKIDQLQKDYEALEQKSAENQQAWDEQVTRLSAQLEAASEAASQQLSNERQQRRNVEQQLTEAQQRVKELIDTLASFRPRADLTSVLQIADGSIVRTVIGSEIVYISLGNRDGVKRGMTFAVYSRTRGIPEDGKGKATIEVVEVFDTTAECKVTSSTSDDPIVEGDAIANPVFDRSRKLNFLVAGDFDLDFDGESDDIGGLQVKKLIVQSGGKVVDHLDTRTDFVVLGSPASTQADADEGDTPETRERTARRDATRQAFDKVVQEAKALSIPTLTRTQFLHFIGVSVPRNVPADKPAF